MSSVEGDLLGAHLGALNRCREVEPCAKSTLQRPIWGASPP